MITPKKSIQFNCEKCGYEQFHIYSLELGFVSYREVMEDHIRCSKCGFDNHIIEEVPVSRQVIVCAAIKNKSGDIICGARHYDPIMSNQIRTSTHDWFCCEQGFIDQFGNFLSREEAFYIAKNKNQIIRKCGGDENKLFSENLY